MVVVSPSGSSLNVTFKSKGCWFVYKLLVGYNMVGVIGAVFATVIICSDWFLLFEVSFTITVKLITLPLVKSIVKFWEHWSLFPLTELFKIIKNIKFSI